MKGATDPMTDERNCPQCNTRMAYAPDGASLQCDRCGFRRPLARPSHDSIAELEELIRYAHSTSTNDLGHSLEASRDWEIWLSLGMTAARVGNADEAYSALSRVLVHRFADDQARKEAWLALGLTRSDPAEKRRCLENVLALDFYEPRARRELAILDGQLDRRQIVNPDALEPVAPAEPPAAATLQRFSCPSCGGRMVYTPDRTSLHCHYCGHHESLPAGGTGAVGGKDTGEQDFISALFTERAHRRPVRMRTFSCSSCGVHFVLPPESLSLTCPYCDSVYVTKDATTQAIAPPDALIPFTSTREAAQRQLDEWLQREGLLAARAEPLSGLYLPVWTFDVHGRLLWHRPGKPPQSWKSFLGSAEANTPNSLWGEAQVVPAARDEVSIDQAHLMADDLLIPATPSLPAALATHLADYDLAYLVPYDLRYLADWPAEHIRLTASDASLKARSIMVQSLRRRHRDQIQKWHPLRPRIEMVVESFRLLLLPVWLGHFWHENHHHLVMVNDQTGMVYTEPMP
jgi:predicted RNA-binding Zn-ribbon protein involved in translation (DUF1610 family)